MSVTKLGFDFGYVEGKWKCCGCGAPGGCACSGACLIPADVETCPRCGKSQEVAYAEDVARKMRAEV